MLTMPLFADKHFPTTNNKQLEADEKKPQFTSLEEELENELYALKNKKKTAASQRFQPYVI